MTVLDEATLERSPVVRPQVRVLVDRCAGCQECVIRCPAAALHMDTATWVAVADSDACVGCRQCVRTCPFSAITVEGPIVVAERHDPAQARPASLLGDVSEVRSGFGTWAEALAEAQRCLACPDPTCVRGCPAHNDIPAFIAAVRDRDLARAHEVLRATSVLPDVCARVCNQAAQCEGACTWSLAGGIPVAIGRLERFVADQLPVPPPSTLPRRGADAGADVLSVGVVGAGPAGIGAAWELLEAGAEVTVYERDERPGGLLGWGIPDFTLPEEIAARPWRQLEAAGVDLRCGAEIRPEDLGALLAGHDAVVLANGAGEPLRLRVPGAELDGVVDATSFLRGAKAALEPGGSRQDLCSSLGLHLGHGSTPPLVLVLGAGNTAMDVARSAIRLGLRALCVDWLEERFALARPDELDEARREGVEVRFSRTLARLVGEGRVEQAFLSSTAQDRPEDRPKVLRLPPEVVDVGLVVMAMGYRNDPAFAAVAPGTPQRLEVDALPDRRWTASGVLAAPAAGAHRDPVGRLALRREQGLWAAAFAPRDRLFVAGDALIGPSTVVEAMAQGRRAAAALLSARPSRPGRPHAGGARRVLVCYESRGGRTARVATEIAAALADHDHSVRSLSIDRVGPLELANAHVVVVGTWVEGLVVARVGPAKATAAWLAGLPRLAGKTAGIFCTFSVAPRGTLPAVRRVLEAKGADVVAQAAFGPGELGTEPTSFGPAGFAAELASRLARDSVPAAPAVDRRA